MEELRPADAEVGQDVDVEPQALGLAASEDEGFHYRYIAFIAPQVVGSVAVLQAHPLQNAPMGTLQS